MEKLRAPNASVFNPDLHGHHANQNANQNVDQNANPNANHHHADHHHHRHANHHHHRHVDSHANHHVNRHASHHANILMKSGTCGKRRIKVLVPFVRLRTFILPYLLEMNYCCFHGNEVYE